MYGAFREEDNFPGVFPWIFFIWQTVKKIGSLGLRSFSRGVAEWNDPLSRFSVLEEEYTDFGSMLAAGKTCIPAGKERFNF